MRARRTPQVNLADRLCDRHAATTPGAPVVIEHRTSSSSAAHTFDDLRTRSAAIAGGLCALGAGRGDRIAVVLDQGFESLAVHVAIQRLGAIAVPISPIFTGRALEHRLTDSATSIVFADEQSAPRVCAIDRPDTLRHRRRPAPVAPVAPGAPGASGARSPGTMRTDELIGLGEPYDDSVAVDRDDPAFIFYTSGTTSAAKGVTLAARLLDALTVGFRTVFDGEIRPTDVFWTPSDWAWLGALGEVVLAAVDQGRPVVACPDRFSPRGAYRLMAEHQVSCAFLAPVVLRRIYDDPPDPADTFALRAIMTGGERFPDEVRSFIEDRFGASLNDDYGLTEGTHLAIGCAARFDTPPGAIGRPLPGRPVAVLGPDARELPAGEIGEIAVASEDPIVMLGYWNGGALDREPVRGRWFRTGDLGHIDDDGCLWFERRIDDLIKIGGVRVSSEEVELAMAAHKSVRDAGVIVVPDEHGNARLAAFVALGDDTIGDAALAEELRGLVRDQVLARGRAADGHVRRASCRGRARASSTGGGSR